MDTNIEALAIRIVRSRHIVITLVISLLVVLADGHALAEDSPTNPRKIRTEALLLSRGVPINPWLPVVEDVQDTRFRAAKEVARRAIVLYALAASGHGEDRNEIVAVLRKDGLWKDVSPLEHKIFLSEQLTDRQRIDATWRVEALWTLLWSINLVDEMPYPTDLCDMDALHRVMAESKDLSSFVEQAKLREKEDILDQLDLVYRLHWAIEDARIRGEESPDGLDSGVVQERHYALNWLTWYDDQWDDITTDT